ncbi:hypothetical protein PSYCG_12790 [Psychrobacter sp. G]|nr:hypothetical protein PSYCG_12790 [Psychrobacter sp. G]
MITRLLKSCKHYLLGSAVTFLLGIVFIDGADGL